MEKVYHPNLIEPYWSELWEQRGYFKPNHQGPAYCIVLPPPNITGSLHMGHGFQTTLMDILVRYHRMLGQNVLWQGGIDHAGIATQMVVERQLSKAGLKRQQLGRDAFNEAVWDWKEKSGNRISQQLRRLGVSIDWGRERFTLDSQYCAAVTQVFVRLYQQGLIYRGKRLVNWDPVLLTAVSDLEVITKEEPGNLWYLRYPLVNCDHYLIVATTRPETLFGDVAIAVHPDDLRYQSFIGQQVYLPLVRRRIPIIADISVDPAFGTGCVKITPAHDFNDYLVSEKHQLDAINIFTPDARLNQNVPEDYQGLDRFVARQKIIDHLNQLDLLEKIEHYTVRIPRGDRSGAVIEPYLTDQWFVRMQSLAEPAKSAVMTGALRFIPEVWTNTYLNWLDQLDDWCISRQIWWGHRIPAWYDVHNNIYVGLDEAHVRKAYDLDSDLTLRQDEDVLDTWFSSGLWPFASLGWPQQTQEFKTFYPTSVLITGFDIIFFWVARMIMLGIHFTDNLPFKIVYVTGLIRDHQGQKMSKTKGNVLDPLDLIDGITITDLIKKRTEELTQSDQKQAIERVSYKQFPQGIPALGADALRFTFCALAAPTRDIRFDLQRAIGYRNFCNKLWNAARFVLQHTQTTQISEPTEVTQTINRWIDSLLQETIVQVQEDFAHYRFDLLAQHLYEFIWDQFCAWYLELVKPLFIVPGQAVSIHQTLLEVLTTCLRLLHPIMPFITEEIWNLLPGDQSCLIIQSYPKPHLERRDMQAQQLIERLKLLIQTIRTFRNQNKIHPKQIICLFYDAKRSDEYAWLEPYELLIKQLAHASLQTVQQLPTSAQMILIDTLQLWVIAQEPNRQSTIELIEKQLKILEKKLSHAQSKLDNTDFIARAPEQIVFQVRSDVAQLSVKQKELRHELKRLQDK